MDSQPKRKSTDSLTHKASKSVLWSSLSAVAISAMKFGTTMVLARLLAPKDFGLLGIAVVITGIVNLFGNLGMGAALIQKQNLEEEGLSTVYWTNLLVGGAMTFAGMIAAPFAAIFFREPELQAIIMCLSFNFILGNLAATHVLFFIKDLQFKKLAMIETFSTIIRVIAILVLAYIGWGVWSIVWGMIVERGVKTAVIIYQVKWRPQWMFSRAKFNELFHFGKNFYGESFVTYLNTNIDYMLTGRLLGTTNLGFYHFAYNVPHLILTFMTENVLGVLYPLYCKVQNDPQRMARGYLKTIQYIALLVFPILAGLFFVAYDFTRLVYGPQWLSAVVPLKILCISSALLSIIHASASLCAALGKPELNLRWSLIKFPVTILAVIVGSHWGIVGVAWATAFMAFFSLIFVRLGLHLVELSFMQYLYALWPATGSSLVMLAAMGTFDSLGHYGDLAPVVRFALNVAIGASAYVLSMRFLFPKVFDEFIEFFRKMFNR